MDMTRGEELAWCAALFEGEGTLYSSGQWGQWHASMCMTDEDVLRRFHRLIGIGSIHPRIKYDLRKDGMPVKPQWAWRISSQEDLLNFCALLQPMMGERRAAKMMECVADLTC